MRVHDARLALPAAASWAAAAWWTTRDSTEVLVCAVLLCAVAVVASRSLLLAVTAACLAIVGISCGWRLAMVEASPVTAAAQAHRIVDLELRVRRDARAYAGFGAERLVVQTHVRRLTTADRVHDVGVRATAFAESGPGHGVRDLVVGSRWVVRGRLAPSDASDEAALIEVLRMRPVGATPWWWAGSEHVRAGIRDAASSGPRAAQALVPALVDGDDAAVDDALAEDFRRSGLTHLLAVSGTNLTIVLAAVLVAGRSVGVRRRGVWVLGAVSIVGFILLARPDPSVVRAAAMGAVGLAAVGYGRRGGVRALSWAVVALVFLDPWLARSAGFVLSVCATTGILLLTEPLALRFQRWMPRWCALAVAVPIAAQLACTPALAAISGEVSLVAVVANLVAAPAVAPTTILGLFGGLLTLVPVIGDVPGALVGGVATRCAAWIVGVARVAGGLDGAAVAWNAPWWLLLLLVPVVLGGLLAIARHPVVVVGLVLGLAVGLWRPPHPGWPPAGWVMVACDVGQGDATVLATGDGEAIVVDAGQEARPVDRCLTRLGVRRVRLLVLTHGDADHVGGVSGVTRGRVVDQVVVGASGGPPLPGVPRHVAVAGEEFTLGPVHARVLWPTTIELASGAARNDASVVLRVELHGLRILLTGDVEPTAQRRLLASGADLAADVLKMPHHGSAHQDPEFLAATGARVVTISAGRDNHHGHPAPAALEMLRSQGAAWWRTDLQGDLAVVVREGRLAVVSRR